MANNAYSTAQPGQHQKAHNDIPPHPHREIMKGPYTIFFFLITMLYRHAPILVFILHKHSHCKGQLINCTKPINATSPKKNYIQQPDSTIQATAGWANKKEKLSLQNKILVGGWPPTHQGKKPMEGETLWDKTPSHWKNPNQYMH